LFLFAEKKRVNLISNGAFAMQNAVLYWTLSQICKVHFSEWLRESVIFFVTRISIHYGTWTSDGSIILLTLRFNLHLIFDSIFPSWTNHFVAWLSIY
jgi:hypothetical protein